jgi:hypothetical protein
MHFTRRLHDGIFAGKITESVRIWQRPHVTVGKRYAFGPGAIEVTALREMEPEEITDALARRTGFADAQDLMSVAKHGPGWRIFLVTFKYRKPTKARARKVE